MKAGQANSFSSKVYISEQPLLTHLRFSDAVLEVVFEVDVNGILKVTATEKTSGRSANITISNSVGKLSSSEIESMING
jgi:L1 cell adhesion molecule like protein